MTGTAQDQKKAYRIISQCKAFFPWYEPQIKDKFERQAWEELKTVIISEVESYTDAWQMVADRQKFADRALLKQILARAEILRRLDPERSKEVTRQKWDREQSQFQRILGRRKY